MVPPKSTVGDRLREKEAGEEEEGETCSPRLALPRFPCLIRHPRAIFRRPAILLPTRGEERGD
ncbi:hypothetical protein BHE74_00035484, partial [Ensete ventricosum]